MKIVVTGGSGQLGTVVLRKLALDRKIQELRVIDVRPPIVASKKLSYVKADIRDPDLARRFEGCDALVHLAFILARWAPREVMHAVNVEGSRNLFAAAAAAGIKKIVYASSVAAYGIVSGHPTPIVEETPRVHQEAFAYAANKFEVEAFLDGFEAEHPEIAIARLRPAILIGTRMEHALGKALEARILPDPGGPPLPCVWDEDVAAAVSLCLQKSARGAFNVVADESLTGAEMARAAGFRRIPVPHAARAGVGMISPLIVRFGGTPPADLAWFNDVPPLVYSSEKAKRELGWAPKYPTALEVMRHEGQLCRGLTDARIVLFFRMIGLAASRMPARDEYVEGTIHLEITGHGGADYTLELRKGRMFVRAGVPRPPTSVVSIRAQVLLDLLAGRLTPATAEITGKIRVEGEPIGGMAVTGMVTMFRTQASAPGPRGWPLRQLSAWFGAPSSRATS